MIIRCEKCSSPICSDDVNLATGLARCRTCNIAFSATLGVSPRPAVKAPAGVVVDDRGKTMRISWPMASGASPIVLSVLVLTILGVAGMIVHETMAMGGGLFPLLLLLPLGVLGYVCIAAIFNRIGVEVTPAGLRVYQAPLPRLLGGEVHQLADIAQIYCREQRGVVEVMILRRDATYTTLMTLLSPTHGLFIEQHLEHHLGIEDRAVSGELPRL